jgi:hypothetical protein
MILRLRPRQKVKQKQQYQRPKECEANVCQGTRGPDGASKKQPESVLKKLGQRFPRNRWNDVSHSANNNGRAHENNSPEDTITYSLEYSFPHGLPPQQVNSGSADPDASSSKSVT